MIDAVPHGSWKTTTFLAGLRSEGGIAPLVLEGPVTGKAAARSREALWATIATVLDTITPAECRNYLTNSGYEFV